MIPDLETAKNMVRDAMDADAGLADWCTANYGRRHKVLVGIDENDFPDRNLYPMVVFWVASAFDGLEAESRGYYVSVMCGVFHNVDKSTGEHLLPVAGRPDIIEYKGVSRAYAMTGHAMRVLKAVFIEYEMAQVDLDIDQVGPFFLADLDVTLKWEYCQGQEPFKQLEGTP